MPSGLLPPVSHVLVRPWVGTRIAELGLGDHGVLCVPKAWNEGSRVFRVFRVFIFDRTNMEKPCIAIEHGDLVRGLSHEKWWIFP